MRSPNIELEVLKRKNTETLKGLLASFTKLGKEVLDEYNKKKDPTYLQIVYQNLFQRLYIGISAIEVLLNQFTKITYFKYPIALQTRACLLDSITIVYLILYRIKGGESDFKMQVARLNYQVAKEIDKEFRNKNIDSLKKQIIYFSLADNFNTDDTFTFNKSIKPIQTKSMATAIADSEYKWFSRAYNLYCYYSKYEHFGTSSKQFLEFHHEYDFDQLVDSTYHVFCSSYIAFDLMQVDKSHLERMKGLRDQIGKMEPAFNPNNYQRH